MSQPHESTATFTRMIVFALFLFSGASGLVYEVVWSRMFDHVLGTTVYAVATVLAVFMGGLALGSWLFGRYADRSLVSGLRLYAWLELGIGLFALALPWLVQLTDRLYVVVWPAVWQSFSGLMTVRVLLAALVLLAPATLMGGTLPVLSRFLVRSQVRAGADIGALYAVNTLGAVVGCFLAGFFLLEWLGVRGSLYAAATLNFGVAGVAFLWSRSAGSRAASVSAVEPTVETPSGPRYQPWQVRLVLILYALSGFSALALEVFWTRSLMYFTSVDAWAFAAMLSAFLLGLGLGSLVMARFAARLRHPMRWLGGLQILAGLTAAASIPLFQELYGALAWIAGAFDDPATLTVKIVTKLGVSLLIMLVPTLLMGAAFPVVTGIYVGARRAVGRSIGLLYALNTVGAIGGSLAGGFALIPLVGLEASILLGASTFVVIGVVALVASGHGRIRLGPALAGLVLLAAVGATNYAFVSGRFGLQAEPMVLKSGLFRDQSEGYSLLFAQEGAAASLVVLENRRGTRVLNINGVSTAFDNYMDMRVHRMLSHLPMLAHPAPRNVLIVGFGMGSTPWGCTQHPVDRVDVVELLRSETMTAPYFRAVNHDVLSHPRLRFIEGDGRNYLLGTRERYDVISFNAIHPRFSAALYTRDFYELCRGRLSPQGVICAWMTQNSMTDDEFRSLVRAFVEVFPHSTLWYCNPEHYCLLGTMEPTRIDVGDWRIRMGEPAVRADLADSGFEDPVAFLARFMCGPGTLARYVEGAPLNTDDRPIIEFSRESKRDERPIALRLAGLLEPPDAILHGISESDHSDLQRFRESMRWIILGEADYWYPPTPSPLRHEIAYRRAIIACPENKDAREHLVFADAWEERVLAARDAQPADPGPWTHLGGIRLQQGRLEEAREALRRALEIRPGLTIAAERLAFTELFAGNPDGAARLLSQIAQVNPDARVIFALGVAVERLGSLSQAAEMKKAALDADPDVQEWLEVYERAVHAMRLHDAR